MTSMPLRPTIADMNCPFRGEKESAEMEEGERRESVEMEEGEGGESVEMEEGERRESVEMEEGEGGDRGV